MPFKIIKKIEELASQKKLGKVLEELKGEPTMNKSFVNAVYYPSWKVYKGQPPSCLQVDKVTHVFYAFLRVNNDGSLRLLDEYGDLQKPVDGVQGCLAALAKLKRQNPHIKTLISIGGSSGSQEFPEMTGNVTARQTFAAQVRDFVDTHRFDGIDIDWEHPQTPEQGRDFVLLLEAARSTLPSPEYLLTTALPTGDYCLKNIDFQTAAEYLDYINLMAYDFVGSWTDVAGNQAQLFAPGIMGKWSKAFSYLPRPLNAYLRKSSSAAVDYLTSKGFPSRKILMGVPAYARNFPRASAVGMPSFGEGGDIDYSDFAERWISHASVDRALVAASFVDHDKGFLSYDLPETVAVKAEYAADHDLGGLFYWTGVSDRAGAQSLVRTGFETLQSRYG